MKVLIFLLYLLDLFFKVFLNQLSKEYLLFNLFGGVDKRFPKIPATTLLFKCVPLRYSLPIFLSFYLDVRDAHAHGSACYSHSTGMVFSGSDIR